MPDMLYAVMSNRPIASSGDCYWLYVCLPLDDSEGCNRYVSLVVLRDGWKIGNLYDEVRGSLPYAYQWLTYFGGAQDGAA